MSWHRAADQHSRSSIESVHQVKPTAASSTGNPEVVHALTHGRGPYDPELPRERVHQLMLDEPTSSMEVPEVIHALVHGSKLAVPLPQLVRVILQLRSLVSRHGLVQDLCSPAGGVIAGWSECLCIFCSQHRPRLALQAAEHIAASSSASKRLPQEKSLCPRLLIS